MFPTCFKTLCRAGRNWARGPGNRRETSAPVPGSPSITGAKSCLLPGAFQREEGSREPGLQRPKHLLFLLKSGAGAGPGTSLPIPLFPHLQIRAIMCSPSIL